ncbi:MAG TPA: hypothetical protein DCE41_21015 [Cytophagales bacterium]|nr:hypothetical protein [Cytophagales bacterium]HAA23829.1 hypothetical protein [Cytophagales bacterium]HAP59540.1 hypothetical protein [Cytophagales bacterium]
MDALKNILLNPSSISSFVDFLPCPVVFAEWQNEDLVVVYVNRSFSQTIGYTLEDIPTANDWWKKAYPDPEYRAHVKKEWEELSLANLDKAAISVKAKVRTKDGRDRWYEVSANLWDRYQAVTLVDVHDLELRNQQLTALNTAKDNLLSVLSHDVRGPLKRIHSMMDMFQKDYVSKEELLDQLGNIGQEVGYALQTIEQTMDWVQHDKAESEERITSVDMEPLLERVLASHIFLAERKQIHLETACEPAQLEIDPEVVRIMIRNLVNNAIKFTPRGGTVTLSNRMVDAGLEVTVKDTGTGLSKEQIEEILEKPGYSALGTENESGTGVGLSIVTSLANKHHIQLSIHSTLEEGSAFTLLFPKK